MLRAPEILRTTPAGHVAPEERSSVDLHGYGEAMRMRDTARIAVPGGAVHLDVFPASAPDGSAARGSVVFVGGLSAYALLYAGFQAELARRGWNVVAVDVRGHGRSSGARGDFTIESLVDDLRGAVAYAQHRFGQPVALMGSSLGGFYALVGANAIAEVECAVSHWIYLPSQPVTRKDARMAPVAKLLARIAPRMRMDTRRIAEWDHVNVDPQLRQNCFDDPLMVWKYTVRGLASGLAYAPPRPLSSLRCPHLVLIGAEDRMTPRSYTRGIYDQLEGDKEWVEIPGAGHMGGLVEQRDLVVEAVDEFLTRRLAVRAEPVAGVTPSV